MNLRSIGELCVMRRDPLPSMTCGSGHGSGSIGGGRRSRESYRRSSRGRSGLPRERRGAGVATSHVDPLHPGTGIVIRMSAQEIYYPGPEKPTNPFQRRRRQPCDTRPGSRIARQSISCT
ncbi:MAG: hypothetical protein GX882_04555 [Methanomicrobiales archaeon]|nr:hypothetical protein [Methanomicrobiales archaeon]